MVDFGSHTTRAGYAGEDCPRVVCPSFYGYIDEPSSSSNGNGHANADAQEQPPSDAMDVDGAAPPATSKGKRKYYVGDDGPTVWRAGMEVDNFMLDGVGESSPCAFEADRMELMTQCTTLSQPRSSCITSCITDFRSTRVNIR